MQVTNFSRVECHVSRDCHKADPRRYTQLYAGGLLMEMGVLSTPNKVSYHGKRDDTPELVFDKEIIVNKDVNGIAITDDNTILLALGTGSMGGLATLDIKTERLTVHQQGRPFRQIVTDSAGGIYTTTQDTIQSYSIDSLDSPQSVLKPGPNVWGICRTSDAQFIYSDVRNKKIYKMNEQGNSMMVKKSDDNKLKSMWSLACTTDRLYISDRKKRQVVCTALDGTYLWRRKLGRPFPKYKKALEDMAYNYFGGICTNPSGQVLVCDTVNNKLTKITPEGAVSHYNDLDLDGPAHVAMNGGCVVIANHLTMLDCVVKVYRLSTTL